ncbi:acyl-CoA dehydrogenase family protein [Heyndrickxia vini]|uniref:Acyl-CoA/acyl-ACP dehydrogenase n=1 Tax=Heyndrickxia vini TaxID=1476025 RepID=A0ABX7E384_9BACI|nr:acyl-CoA dehydrogenase family protein [Heyndrickxia vini]QQZ10164.1 acyl-CoA/acyl-ACP dehydrogenase [Heyndrickxia vini]
MDFALNQEQELFRGYVRKYLESKGLTKIARDYMVDQGESFPAIHTGLAELGCSSINISECYGGMELGALDLVPVLEEIGRALLPGLFLETNTLVVPLLEQFGTEEQKASYLPDIAEGKSTFTFAWLEHDYNYQPSGIKLKAHQEKNSIIIDGVKTLVPEAQIADYFVVVARTGKEEKDISLVIVDRSQSNMTIRPQKTIDEARCLSEVTFNHLEVPPTQILGPINGGWTILQEGLLSFNAALSTIMVGSTDKIVEMAVEYANIREQFGQPIGRFQAVKHKIVDMKVDLETARSLAYYANWALENKTDDRVQAITIARIFATDAFIRAASNNIQIHGGIGFTEEVDCHLYLKRARFYENYLGSTQQYYEQAATALGW